MQTLYTELKNKGLQVIAVDGGDPKDKIDEFAQQSKTTFPIVMDDKQGAASTRYGVLAIPTNYVVDGTGKIVFRCVGYDEPGIRAALAKLGVK